MCPGLLYSPSILFSAFDRLPFRTVLFDISDVNPYRHAFCFLKSFFVFREWIEQNRSLSEKRVDPLWAYFVPPFFGIWMWIVSEKKLIPDVFLKTIETGLKKAKERKRGRRMTTRFKPERRLSIRLAAVLLWAGLAQNAFCQVINAGPAEYRTYLSSLGPGDILNLTSGTYPDGLRISEINGTPAAPIVITGPESGDPAVFEGNASRNTVSISASSYVTIRHLKIDGRQIANIDGIKAEGNAGNWAHHIIFEDNHIVGHGANQQTTGISTKCAAWDWVIRRNIIEGAGTGMYLGNSDGTAPFVNGIIEYNLVFDTIGYNLQIKHQNEGLRTLPGMTLNGKTVLRYNVFSKQANASSGQDARPNLLVGNFPASGNGAGDYYEIYGNFFYQNPFEALFQGTGNIAFYNNLGVNHAGGSGINIQSHNGFLPRQITIFNNTVLAANGYGIRISSPDPGYFQYILGNAIFADTPIAGDNISENYANAGNYINNASTTLGAFDPYPLAGTLKGAALDTTQYQFFQDYDIDFDGTARDWTFRGAYSGQGTNPGWKPALSIRPAVVTGPLGGDIDGDGHLDLADAILGLRITAAVVSDETIFLSADVDSNQKIGIAEVLFILRFISGI